MSQDPPSVSLDVRVRYSETDQMGVVYHANYLVWCELGRTELIRRRGPSYADLEREGILLAVAEANVRYHAGARYDDLVRVHCWVEEVRSRMVTFAYRLERIDEDGAATRLATARTVLIAIDRNSRPRQLPPNSSPGSAMPDRMIRRAGLALAALLLWTACVPAAPPTAAPALAPAPDPAAIAALIRMQDERSFDEPLLRDAAASPSPGVRAEAARAMARLRRPAALPLLRALLADPDTGVAATAAFALGQVGDTAAVAALAPTLAAPATRDRPTVAAEAAYALGKLRSAPARAALRATLSTAPQALPAEVVGSALLAIWRFPREPAGDPIAPWLASPDPELRWRAAYALTRRPDPAAAAPLLPLARDPDPRVRALAIRALAAPLVDSVRVDRDGALRAVLDATRDADYATRVNAVRVLGTFPDAPSVARLTELLRGGEAHSAVAAAESLGRLGSAAVASAGSLESLARDPAAQLFLRTTALEALGRVDAARGAALAASFGVGEPWRLRAAAGRVLASTPLADPAALERLTVDPDGRVASATLQARLDAAGDAVAPLRSLLLGALESPDVWVRTTALGGVARLADPASLPALLDAYDRAGRDTVNDAALAAVDALGALATAGTTPDRAFFARFPRSSDVLVRQRVAERLGDAARAEWGDPLPVGGRRTPAEYRDLVARLWLPARDGRLPRVRIATTHGTIELELDGERAPLTVESFLGLAARGFFDGQEWPRVVPNFVLQGGDPRGDTNGGPGYSIRDEINRLRYDSGTLGMALSGPDTGGSQWFVTHSPQPHLDGIYTVFGRVVAGQQVAERLLPGDRILAVTSVPDL